MTESLLPPDDPQALAEANLRLQRFAGFDLVAEGPEPWDDWLSTRYEQKALREGRVPHYVTFRRRG